MISLRSSPEVCRRIVTGWSYGTGAVGPMTLACGLKSIHLSSMVSSLWTEPSPGTKLDLETALTQYGCQRVSSAFRKSV